MKNRQFSQFIILVSVWVLLAAGAAALAAAFLPPLGTAAVVILLVLLSAVLWGRWGTWYMKKLKDMAGPLLVSTSVLSTPEMLVGELCDALRLRKEIDDQELHRDREYMIARFLADHSNENEILDLQQRAKLLLHSDILQMYGNWFTVLYVSIENRTEVFSLHSIPAKKMDYVESLAYIRSTLEDAVQASELGYCAEYDKDVICFVNLRDTAEDTPQAVLEEKKQRLIQASRAAADQIYRDLGLRIRIAVGDPFPDIRELRRVVDDLQTLLDFTLLSGNDAQVVTIDDVPPSPPSVDQREAPQLEQRFFQAMAAQDLSAASAALDSIFQLELQGPLDSIRWLRQKMCLRLRFAADVYGIRPEQVEDLEEALTQLECASSLDEMRKIAASTLGLLEPQSVPSVNHSSAEAIAAFIRENYADPELSLMMLSEKFGMSQSCISRAIKNATGERMTDFIHSFRIAEAKRLLVETDLTIYEICDRVGYNTNWTMTRAFKRYTNMTPGAYREQSRHQAVK